MTCRQPATHAALVLCLLTVTVGCKHVRDFLIPPPSGRIRVRGRPTPGRLLADLVLRNANFGDRKNVMVAIGKGIILGVGSEREAGRFVGPGTSIRDVRQGWLAPAFVDSHVHLDGMALLQDAVDLRDANELAVVGAKFRKAAELTGQGNWLWAFGADRALLAKLDATKLDNVAVDIPVWVTGADGHAAVVSKALLAMLPTSARSLFEGRNGKLDAVTARALWRLLPMPSAARARPLILNSLGKLMERGVSTVHAMGATVPFLNALVDLERRGRLRSRVLIYLDAEAPKTGAFIAERAARRVSRKPGQPKRQSKPLGDDKSRRVHVVGIKLWLDGTLGARTAALSRNYADAPHKGRLMYDDEAVLSLLARVDAAGLQLALHAIGDAAVEQVARVLLRAERPGDAAAVRIEHAQVVSDATLRSLARLPVVCAIQPLHELDDRRFARQRLGNDRMAWAYRAASLARACTLTSGSDAPISESQPWQAWRHLVLGKRSSGAAEAMTSAQAWATLIGDPVAAMPNRIEAGGTADLVLWSHRPNVSEKPPTRLLMIIDGEEVFVDASLPKARMAPSLPGN